MHPKGENDALAGTVGGPSERTGGKMFRSLMVSALALLGSIGEDLDRVSQRIFDSASAEAAPASAGGPLLNAPKSSGGPLVQTAPQADTEDEAEQGDGHDDGCARHTGRGGKGRGHGHSGGRGHEAEHRGHRPEAKEQRGPPAERGHGHKAHKAARGERGQKGQKGHHRG